MKQVMLRLPFLIPFLLLSFRVLADKEVTRWDQGPDRKYFLEFYDFSFASEDNYLERKQIMGGVVFANSSKPIVFSGVKYYLEEHLVDPSAWKVCECSVIDSFFDFKNTISFTSDISGNSTFFKRLFYECGFLGSCRGLQCVQPNFWVIGGVGFGAILFILAIGGVIFGFRKFRQRRMKARDMELKEVENRQMNVTSSV